MGKVTNSTVYLFTANNPETRKFIYKLLHSDCINSIHLRVLISKRHCSNKRSKKYSSPSYKNIPSLQRGLSTYFLTQGIAIQHFKSAPVLIKNPAGFLRQFQTPE